MAVLNLYPKPSNGNEFNNYNFTTTANAPDYQFDIKIDHQINDKNRINGRYSRSWSNFTTPLTLGDGFDNDGIASGVTVAQNGSFEYSRTINPRIVWTSHAESIGCTNCRHRVSPRSPASTLHCRAALRDCQRCYSRPTDRPDADVSMQGIAVE
jgi:hypothetical protein